MSDFKTVIEYLGLNPEKVKTLEDFKKEFDPNFIRTSAIHERKDLIEPLINAAYGKRVGVTETELKKVAKEHGLDLSTEEFKDKKIEEIARIVVTKAIENRADYVSELETKVKATGDGAMKEWQTKLEKVEQKLKDKEALLNKTSADFESYKTESSNKMKSFQIGYLDNEKRTKLKLKKDISDIEKAGFNAILSQNYQLDLDEKEGLIVRTKDGSRIANEKTAGTFKTWDEILEQEAVKAKLFELNPNSDKKFNHTMVNQNQNNNLNNQNNQNNNRNGKVRKVHPSLLK